MRDSGFKVQRSRFNVLYYFVFVSLPRSILSSESANLRNRRMPSAQCSNYSGVEMTAWASSRFKAQGSRLRPPRLQENQRPTGIHSYAPPIGGLRRAGIIYRLSFIPVSFLSSIRRGRQSSCQSVRLFLPNQSFVRILKTNDRR